MKRDIIDKYQDMLITLELVQNYGFIGAVDKIIEEVNKDILKLTKLNSDTSKEYLGVLKWVKEDLEKMKERG